MRKKIYSTLFILCLFSSFCFSQNGRTVDSLLNIFRSTSNDTQKVEVYNRLSQTYCSIDFNKALYYNELGINLAKKINHPHKLADAYNIQGIIFLNLGKTKEADSSLTKAIELHINNGNKKGIASGYGNLGAMYFMIGNYGKSLENQLKCLKINEDLNDKNGIAITLMNIANIHFIQKNFSEANKYYNDCRLINKQLGNLHGELSAINNIGTILIEQRKPDEAITYYNYIKKITEEKQDEYNTEYAFAINGLGNSYRLKGEYDKAHFYLGKAFELYGKQNNTFRLLEVAGNISALYLKEKNYTKSIEYCKTYLEKAKAMDANQHERDACEFLYESYSGIKDYENALIYHKKFMLLKDTILNKENMKNMSELETKYETEKKENQNKTLINENQIQSMQISNNRIYVFALLALLFIVLSFAVQINRQNKLKAQQRSLMLEHKLLRSQMNPHFIFNSLIAIESYIYKNEPKEAGKYLSGFARLMRLILENSREEFIPLSKEIKTLEYYLQLQKNRFDDMFDYTIELSENIDPDAIAIPPMLAQPFIENSIEHGLKNIDKKGEINIRFSLNNNQLIFEVKDNGIGIEKSMADNEQKKHHHSLATTITMERLTILNKRKRNKISFHIDELKNPEGHVLGTRVSFAIPYQEI